MANYIDIKDFDGVLTNADIEDLPDNVAQEIKNLKIQAGKLEKTFGAGTPSGIPTIGLSFVNTTLGSTYTVYNIFTFVSDKFEMGSSNLNDAGDGFRYLLVTIGTGDNKTKLWWFDPSLPDVTDHLQVEDNIMWFQTASAHSIVEDDYVLVQDCKNNASPQALISGAGVYEQADHIPSTTTVGVNTDIATGWGGNFFDTTLASGISNISFGGKIQTHLQAVDSINYGSPSEDVDYLSKIAIASMNGKVLSLAVVIADDGDQEDIIAYNGSSVVDLSETNYNSYKSKTNFKVCSMIGFNNAIYVHYSYTDGSPSVNYNPVAKYTLSNDGTVNEAVVASNLSTNDNTDRSYMHITGGFLYVFVEDNGLYRINTSDNVSTTAFTGISPALDMTKVKGLTSITQTNNLTSYGLSSGSEVAHNYLFVAVEIAGGRCQLYAHDLNDGSNANWYAQGTAFDASDVYDISSMDFKGNGNKSHSVVIHYQDSPEQYLKYTTHNNTSVINGYSNVSSTFGTSTTVNFIASTYNSPLIQYLVVGTDDVSSPASNGSLYLVNKSLAVTTVNAQTTGVKATWNPRCFADCVTETHGGQDYFKHAKGYIAVYGTESTGGSPVGASADIYRMTDIGWLANTWNGSGDCEYRWIDVGNRYDVGTLYHKKDRNPIIPFGDTLRVLPGNIAKVGSNESKGAWLGWIDRSLFNGNKVYGPSFFAKENRLTNPFTFKNVELNLTDEEIRQSDIVKYTVTAIYDGVQETPIQDESIRQIVTNSDSSDDVSKSEVKLVLDLPITTINERITGLNVYRAEKISGVYETYKLIVSYNFVDTGDDSLTVSTSSDTNLIINLEAFSDKTIFVKDSGGAINSWLESSVVNPSRISLNVGGVTDNHSYDWSTGYTEFAIKVGSYEKQKIEKIDAITGYAVTGSTLNEDLTTTDNIITVNNVSNIVNTTIYKLGFRDLSIGASQGDEDDDADDYERIQVTAINGNDLTVTRGYPNYSISGVSYTNGGTTITHSANGSITVGHTMTGPTGIATGSRIISITDATHFEINLPVTATQSSQTITALTNARQHNKFDPIKSDDLSITGWYKFVTDDAIKGRKHNDSWKIYREKVGLGWNTQISTVSNGAFAGKYMGIIIPQPSEVTDGDITMAPWRDTDGTMKISSIIGQKFTATGGSPAETQTFKVEKAYASWDEQLGFTYIETDKAFQAGNFVDSEVIISTFSNVSAVISSDLNEISIIDKGLSSLGEHPYGQEDKIKVNAQYAKILKGRLFLGNIVLDPGNENETQNDWVAYSDLNAYDVRPVSNVIPFPDREGGQITGLSELFGRLIVFKAQAIFVLDVVDPSDPTTWSRKETKINIGNIAPEGIVEVHDSVYFVHHDGIYRLDANTVASSDATPSIMEKITLGIEDQFLLANDKKAVKGVYDQKNNEILYSWEVGSPAVQVVWAYHIVLNTWRKIDTSANLDILSFGENSGPIAWDNTDTGIKKFDVSEAVGTAWKSKRFRLDLDQKRLIRYGMVKFTGTDTLTVNIYLDGSGSVSFTKSITADGGVNRFPIKRYGKNFEIELTTPSSTNSFSVEQMRIETE